MLLGFLSRLKRAEVLSLSSVGILLTGIQTVCTRFQFLDHVIALLCGYSDRWLRRV
jgi:hypothetical protein